MSNICILDYGSGNVRSVYNLFTTVTSDVVVSNDAAAIRRATHLVLPGVGAFGAAMQKIADRVPLDLLQHEVIARGKPFLGICVGMQVLAQKGFEFGEYDGLSWIDGHVDALQTNELPVPHIGWNSIEVARANQLLDGLGADPDFYFLHSFVMRPVDPSVVAASTVYGERFCCVIQRDNIFGVQFHPEKSQKAGSRLVRNFLAVEPR